MNVELLERVKHAILAEPSAFRMDVWSCGTAHCIGGYACLLSGLTPKVIEDGDDTHCVTLTDGRQILRVSTALLDLKTDYNEEDWDVPYEAERLLMEEYWPDDLQERYDAADPQSIERAQIAVERIDRFIASNGKD